MVILTSPLTIRLELMLIELKSYALIQLFKKFN
jgi:hypothetical protein